MYPANLQIFRSRLPYVVSRLMEIHLHAYDLSSNVDRTRLCPCRRRAKDAVQTLVRRVLLHSLGRGSSHSHLSVWIHPVHRPQGIHGEEIRPLRSGPIGDRCDLYGHTHGNL
jgi:hypothetical protein